MCRHNAVRSFYVPSSVVVHLTTIFELRC